MAKTFITTDLRWYKLDFFRNDIINENLVTRTRFQKSDIKHVTEYSNKHKNVT